MLFSFYSTNNSSNNNNKKKKKKLFNFNNLGVKCRKKYRTIKRDIHAVKIVRYTIAP